MEKEKPKVSVIIPVYGVEKYLRQCLDSVLNQTLKELEIIVLDDGGKDNCPQIIDEYAAKDNRIIAIHKENGGYGHTCNRGLEIASGEYIAILEPDDYIESNMYEDLYNIAQKHESDIVKSCFYDNLQADIYQKISKAKWKEYIPEDRSFTIKEYPFFLYYHPSIWSCIYKNEFVKKYNLQFVEAPGAGWTDNPFQVQTMCLAERINYTSKAYYYWRRVNINESDDLKDYTIPFKRSDEIHKWLEDNNINDENILIQLFRRELAYINIILGMENITDMSNCISEINRMMNRFSEEKFLANEYVRKQERITYKSIKKNPINYRFKLLFKRYRKKLIQFRINSREIYIQLLGKTIIRRNYDT